MENLLKAFSWIVGNYQLIISGLVGVFTSLAAIALLIPGDQPEKALQAIVDFLKKFSAKPPASS